MVNKLAPWLEGQGEGSAWATLEKNNHVKEWQRTLIALTLLSKKFKVGPYMCSMVVDPE